MKRHSSDATEHSVLAGPQTVRILPQFLWSWFLFSSIGSHSSNRIGALEDFGSSVLLPRAPQFIPAATEAPSPGLFQYPPAPSAGSGNGCLHGTRLSPGVYNVYSILGPKSDGLRALPALISSNPFLALQELPPLYVKKKKSGDQGQIRMCVTPAVTLGLRAVSLVET